MKEFLPTGDDNFPVENPQVLFFLLGTRQGCMGVSITSMSELPYWQASTGGKLDFSMSGQFFNPQTPKCQLGQKFDVVFSSLGMCFFGGEAALT